VSGSDVTVSGGAAGAADGNNEVGGAVGEGVIGRPNRDGEDDGYGGGEYSGGMYVEGGVPNCGINGYGEDDIGSGDGAAGAGSPRFRWQPACSPPVLRRYSARPRKYRMEGMQR